MALAAQPLKLAAAMTTDANEGRAFLTVGVDAPAHHRWGGALPIQVRDVYKLVLTASGISNRGMSLPAGHYLVTALLPNGDVATVDEIVDLKPGEDLHVKLSVPSFEVPANLVDTTTFGDKIKAFARPLTDIFSSYTFAVVKGNWLPGMTEPGAHPAIIREETTRSSIQIDYPDCDSWIEIASKNGCTYLAIPVDMNYSTIIQWSVNGDTREVAVKIDFENGDLNSFFDFVRNDQAQGARTISQTMIARSEGYMMDKGHSPLLAVLGAYVLLRANELEGMDVWTANLVEWFAWLPDALAVRIEYLARQGDHATASKLLLEAPSRGVPWFRSGIGYLESRSRIYASVGASRREALPLDDAEIAKIGVIAKTFGELASALDMTQSTTVLRRIPRIG